MIRELSASIVSVLNTTRISSLYEDTIFLLITNFINNMSEIKSLLVLDISIGVLSNVGSALFIDRMGDKSLQIVSKFVTFE